MQSRSHTLHRYAIRSRELYPCANRPSCYIRLEHESYSIVTSSHNSLSSTSLHETQYASSFPFPFVPSPFSYQTLPSGRRPSSRIPPPYHPIHPRACKIPPAFLWVSHKFYLDHREFF